MKFMIDDAHIIDNDVVEEINESTGIKNKNYYLKGIFSTPGQINRNGRIYPKELWEKEIQKYQQEIRENSVNTLGEWEHPSRTVVDPLQAVIKMLEIKMDNGVVYGKAKILNNNSEKTNQLKALIDEGMKIGVSSRGVGSVKNGIVESFKLVTWDAVAFPSDYNSNLEGITESLNEALGNVEFMIDSSGNIKPMTESCNSDCEVFNKKDVDNAILSKFTSLFEDLKKVNLNEEIRSDVYTVLKDGYYKLWESYPDKMVSALKKLTPDEETQLMINVKDEIKIFSEINTLKQKSKLGIKL